MTGSLCCSLCAELCLCVCTDGPMGWQCLLPVQHFPCLVVPWISSCFWWCMDVLHPGFASCLWPSMVFRGQHIGTGNGDVLFPLQFSPFPAGQDRLLVGRQGQAAPECCNRGLWAVLIWHAWGSTLGPLIFTCQSFSVQCLIAART